MEGASLVPPVGEIEAALRREGLSPSRWGNGPGDRYPVHEHGYDKVIVAAAGAIAFRLPDADRTLDLLAGDRLELPAGTAHAALVGPDGVSCLEAHLPPRLAAGLRHLPGWAAGVAGGDAAIGRPHDPPTAAGGSA